MPRQNRRGSSRGRRDPGHDDNKGDSMKLRIATALASCAFAAAASAQSTADLNADGRNSDNVLTYGMGYHQNRYSPLKQVNKQTVKRLVPAWNVSRQSNYGGQGHPLLQDRPLVP